MRFKEWRATRKAGNNPVAILCAMREVMAKCLKWIRGRVCPRIYVLPARARKRLWRRACFGMLMCAR